MTAVVNYFVIVVVFFQLSGHTKNGLLGGSSSSAARLASAYMRLARNTQRENIEAERIAARCSSASVTAVGSFCFLLKQNVLLRANNGHTTLVKHLLAVTRKVGKTKLSVVQH